MDSEESSQKHQKCDSFGIFREIEYWKAQLIFSQMQKELAEKYNRPEAAQRCRGAMAEYQRIVELLTESLVKTRVMSDADTSC